MDFNYCVFNTQLPGIPFLLHWMNDSKGIFKQHMTTRYAAPNPFRGHKANTRVAAPLTGHGTQSHIHAYLLTHIYTWKYSQS